MSTKGTILSGICDKGEAYAYEETIEGQYDIMGNFGGYNVYFQLSSDLVEINISDGINIKINGTLEYDWNICRLPEKFRIPTSGILSIDYDCEGFEIVLKGGSTAAKCFYLILSGNDLKTAEDRLLSELTAYRKDIE